jgi:hypothetical protein
VGVFAAKTGGKTFKVSCFEGYFFDGDASRKGKDDGSGGALGDPDTRV